MASKTLTKEDLDRLFPWGEWDWVDHAEVRVDQVDDTVYITHLWQPKEPVPHIQAPIILSEMGAELGL